MRLHMKDGTYEGLKISAHKLLKQEPGSPIVAVVSDESVDTDGDILHAVPSENGKGWLLDDFNRRPRMFWMHNAMQPNLAQAATRAYVDQKQAHLVLEAVFDSGDSLAMDIDRKYRDDVLHEWSVRFVCDPTKTERRDKDEWGYHFWEPKLIEVSPVNLGANENTHVLAKALGIADINADDIEASANDIAELKEALDEFNARLQEVEGLLMEQSKFTEKAAEAASGLDQLLQNIEAAQG